MRRKLWFALLGVMLIGMTACGKQGTEGKASLTIGNQPYTQGIPIYLAEEEGLYEGIETESLVFVSGNTQNEALGANEWEVGVTGLPPAIFGGVSYGLKIIGFSVDDTVSPRFFVRPDSDILTVQGAVSGCPDIYGNADTWRGKQILCTTATSAHLMLVATLEKLGLTEADVEIVHMDPSQALTAFKAGEGDVLACWPPIAYSVDESWVMAASGVATGEQIPIVVVASEKALAEKRDVVKSWLKQYYEHCESMAGDLDRLAQTLKTMELDNGLTIDDEGARKIVEERPLPTLEEQLRIFGGEPGQTEADAIVMKYVDIFTEEGRISKEDRDALAESGFVDSSLLQEIAAGK
ncbi:MAG: hypothetical protein HFI32_02020 [Lachnospiraceae bacterium]|nr:hypothetical protein [Lachnospiraceae bacterium]